VLLDTRCTGRHMTSNQLNKGVAEAEVEARGEGRGARDVRRKTQNAP
jgi:hypothetical protein